MTTMHDVAREAGVSTASVSAVINDKTGEVSSETRHRILNAIDKIGYRPNHTARQLKTGIFNTIALISENPTLNALETPEFARILSSINDTATESGLDLLFPTSMGARNVVDVMDNLVSRGLDGALILGPVSLKRASLKAIDDCPVPLVCMDSYQGFSKTVTIDYDNIGGMRQAVSKLISLGHSKITYIRPSAGLSMLHRQNAGVLRSHAGERSDCGRQVHAHRKRSARRVVYNRYDLRPGSPTAICDRRKSTGNIGVERSHLRRNSNSGGYGSCALQHTTRRSPGPRCRDTGERRRLVQAGQSGHRAAGGSDPRRETASVECQISSQARCRVVSAAS